jgi:hypothetical protein
MTRGVGGKRSLSEGLRGANHSQTCAKGRTGAAAVTAELESAVRFGRGDEVNRHAEMANLTICRDLLQNIVGGL